jgi:DNA-binding LacI/PurR family transcriptional regulator
MALKERGVIIPGEKSLGGMGIDIDLTRTLEITMATPDFDALGHRLVESLVSRTTNASERPRLILVRENILIRSSFAPPPSAPAT